MVDQPNIPPTVSVLMPVHNASAYVAQAVESILKQTFTDFEFIIVNDASTDDTPAILQSYEDSRIRLIHNDENQGVTQSLNLGLEVARGKYIARMDADDISLPNRLDVQVKYLDAHPNVGVLGTNALFIDAHGHMVNDQKPHVQSLLNADYLRWALNWNNPVLHPSVMLRKQILDAHHLTYDTNRQVAQDYALWLKLVEVTDIVILEDVLLHYRFLATSITRNHQEYELNLLHNQFKTHLSTILEDQITLNEDAVALLHSLIHRQPITNTEYRSAAELLLRFAQYHIEKSETLVAVGQIKSDAVDLFRRLTAVVDGSSATEDHLYILFCYAKLVFGKDFASMGYQSNGEPDEHQKPIEVTHFQVLKNIPRFVALENYTDAFGKQWNVYRKTQLDSYTRVPLSRTRLERAAGGSLEMFRGKNVLEAGCGAGRFTEVLLQSGANVFAMDLSNAVEANYENCSNYPNYFVCQADLFNVPVADEQFDGVICFGVLQATPNPEEALEALCRYIKPGGYLIIDIYPPNYPMTLSRRMLRSHLVDKSPEYTIKVTERIRDILWPAHRWLWQNKGKPGFASVRQRFIKWSPLVDYHDVYLDLGPELLKQWAGLDMHDTVTDYYKHLRSVDDITATLKSLDMIDIHAHYGGNGVEANARKPERTDDPELLLQRITPSAVHPTLRFEEDPYPGRPKILFIGQAESPHTRGTIDMLDDARFNVRVFSLPHPNNLFPPHQWKKRVYITNHNMPPMVPGFDPITRKQLYPSLPGHLPSLPERVMKRVQRSVEYRLNINQPISPEAWLAKIIREWKPDIIETLGIHPSGAFYLRAREQFNLAGISKWSLTIRGGLDYELNRYHPDTAEMTHRVVQKADKILSDNEVCLQDALKMGAKPEQIASVRVIPGSGGLHVDKMLKLWQEKTSERRVIVIPKAFEYLSSLAIPMFEALQLAWDKIQPCEIYLLSMFEPIAEKWYWHLPEDIRAHCHPIEHLPHDEFLQLLMKARVMLAPSLIDGTPNVALEAMAAGAVPILSPLKTLTPIFEADKNVLFARNLYPEEIATALVRAMNDDALVDTMAQNNISVAQQMLDRNAFATKYTDYYEALARGEE